MGDEQAAVTDDDMQEVMGSNKNGIAIYYRYSYSCVCAYVSK